MAHDLAAPVAPASRRTAPHRDLSEGVDRAGARARPLDAMGSCLVLVTGHWFDLPFLVLLGLVGLCLSGARRWLAWDLAVVSALPGLVASAVVLGQLAAAVDLPLHRGTFVVVACLLTAAARLLPGPPLGQATRAAPYGRLAGVAYLPSGALLLLAAGQAASPQLAASWSLLGTDTGRHMAAVSALRGTGSLSYADDGYPRGLHFLLALISPSGGAAGAALQQDLVTVASATVLTWCLLAAATSCLCLRACVSMKVPAGVAVLAAAGVSGALVLGGSFVRAFVLQSAGPSVLASVVLLVVPLTVLGLPRGRARSWAVIVAAAVSTVLLAHLWQALAPLPLVAAGAALGVPRHGRHVTSPSAVALARPVTTAAAAVAVALLGTLAAVPVLALTQADGVATAAIPGSLPAVPQALAVVAVAAAVGSSCLLRRPWARAVLGQTSALIAVLGALVLLNGGAVRWTDYYPQKIMWFGALSLLPVGTACLAFVLWRTCTRVRAVVVARCGARSSAVQTVLAATVAAAAFAVLAPPLFLATPPVAHLVAPGPQAELSWRRMDIAREHALAHAPAVAVPVDLSVGPRPDPSGDTIVSVLLRHQTGQPENRGRPDDVCADVRTVARGGPAVVLTALPLDYAQRLLAARGCPGVPVVRVPGGSTDPFFLPEVGVAD